MNLKYLLDRWRLFRREYLHANARRLRFRWMWLWHFFSGIGIYLFHGELRQIRNLQDSLRQKDAYIRFLQTGAHPDIEKEPASPLRQILAILFLPLAVLGFLLKKAFRFSILRNHPLQVSPPGAVSAANGYTGNSGRLVLRPRRRRSLPGGLVLLHYTLETRAVHLQPVLHVDAGNGFTREYSIPLPPPANLEQTLLIELPARTRGLEFSPGNRGAEYELRDARMKETNTLAAAWYLHKLCGFTPAEGLHMAFTRRLPGVRRPMAHKAPYGEWLRKYDRLSQRDRRTIMAHIETLTDPPLFSLFIRPDRERLEVLRETVLSIGAQLYGHWEILLLVDDSFSSFDLAKVSAWEKGGRTRIIRGGSANTTLREAAAAAEGDFSTLIRAGDLLAAHALYLLADRVIHDDDLQVLYSDHDVMDASGRRSDPCFKPDWNPDLFAGGDYLRPFTLYRTTLLRQSLEEDEPPGDDTLNFRVLAHAGRDTVAHIPFLLYHRRPYNINDESERIAPAVVQEYLDRSGIQGEAVANPLNEQRVRVRYALPAPLPQVSLIVLTRNRHILLSNCLKGLLEETDYDNLEVIVIDNGSDETETLDYLEQIAADSRVTVIRRDEPFNFSALNNFAVTQASGEIIGLVNNDISVIEPLWLQEMVSHIVRPGVGIVGAKLVYGNETIQHGGVIVGVGGVGGHAFRHFPRYHPGYCDRLHLTQEVSCVTAACLLTTQSVYNAVGGLEEEHLKVAFNDVDFSLKVREHGYRIIWTPFADLYHLESASRGSDLAAENLERWQGEYDYIREKWAEILRHDPAYNPNLSNTEEDFSLANPPRVVKPWERHLLKATGY